MWRSARPSSSTPSPKHIHRQLHRRDEPLGGLGEGDEADGITRIELRDGSIVEVLARPWSSGDPVVVSVRPEFVFPFTSGLHASIDHASPTWARTGVSRRWRTARTQWTSMFRYPMEICITIGQEIYLMVNKKAAVVYPRPTRRHRGGVKLE